MVQGLQTTKKWSKPLFGHLSSSCLSLPFRLQAHSHVCSHKLSYTHWYDQHAVQRWWLCCQSFDLLQAGEPWRVFSNSWLQISHCLCCVWFSVGLFVLSVHIGNILINGTVCVYSTCQLLVQLLYTSHWALSANFYFLTRFTFTRPWSWTPSPFAIYVLFNGLDLG